MAADQPVGYRMLWAVTEYRAVFVASALSWTGDYLCKAAVTLLVYERTSSALASGAAFAIGYLPWLLAGPVLAAVAERYPARTVMIICDLIRAALIGLVAIPGVPIPVLFALLLAGGLASPPFEAARSAQLPQILTDDRYPLALALNNSVLHAAQVAGYALGGVIAGYSPQVALALNALTFVGSAVLLRLYVRKRPAALTAARRTGLWRETGQGYAVVFGDPLLRAIAIITFGVVTFVIVPEGLAAAWASDLGGGGRTQGLIMAANPLGVAIGGLVLNRLLSPRVRTLLMRPLAVLAPLVLVPALFNPPLVVVVVVVTVSGTAMALLMPAAQTLFKEALAQEYRARAFGVMNGGVQLAQGAAILITGALSERLPTPTVIGAWCAAGTVLMLLATFRPLTDSAGAVAVPPVLTEETR